MPKGFRKDGTKLGGLTRPREIVTVDGVSLTIKEWAARFGFKNKSTIYTRAWNAKRTAKEEIAILHRSGHVAGTKKKKSTEAEAEEKKKKGYVPKDPKPAEELPPGFGRPRPDPVAKVKPLDEAEIAAEAWYGSLDD